MQKILEKFMKKYWKNAKKTGKVREIRQSKKVGTMLKGRLLIPFSWVLFVLVLLFALLCFFHSGRLRFLLSDFHSNSKNPPLSGFCTHFGSRDLSQSLSVDESLRCDRKRITDGKCEQA